MREGCCRHCLPAYHHRRPWRPNAASCTSRAGRCPGPVSGGWRRGRRGGGRRGARGGGGAPRVRLRLRRRLVLVRVKAAVAGVAGVRGGRRRRRRGGGGAGHARGPALVIRRLLAPGGGVVAEERLRLERLLGLRERAAELADGPLH